MFSVSGKPFTVLGLARSGLAAANWLARHGADVVVSDKAEAHKLPVDRLDPRVERVLGREFVRKGDTVVISPGIKPFYSAHALAHDLGSEVISDIELFARLVPCPMVAVTGTDGKSTTTALVGELCRAAGYNTFVGGNIGTACMEGLDSLDSASVAVLEISCFQLTHCFTLRPRSAVFTNLAEDHVDYHGSLDAYFAAKKRLCRNMGAGDTIVINRDDPQLQAWELPRGTRRRTFGWQSDADAWCDGTTIHIRSGANRSPLTVLDRLKLVGLHNAENIMAAALAVDGVLADCQDLVATIEAFPGLEHRMEFVRTIGGVSFYNDSKATNPHAAMAVVRSFPDKFILLAGGYDKGSDFGEFGSLVAQRTSHTVLFGATQATLAAAIPAGTEVSRVETLKEAINLAYSLAAPGQKVILAPACASFDQFSDFEDRGRKFKQWVHELGDFVEKK